MSKSDGSISAEEMIYLHTATERAERAEAECDKLRDVLAKISDIRDDIIGRQGVNWSAHIYPLVAALGEAGFDGVGYDVALERALTADQEYERLRAENERLREALWPFAKASYCYDEPPYCPDDEDCNQGAVTVGDLRRADAALSAAERTESEKR